MKKIIPFWPIAAIIFAFTMWQCNPKTKTPGTVLINVVDTTKIIDTTIIEDGIAPLAESEGNLRVKDKEEKQKKIKIICSFGQKKFNLKKRPISEAPGGKHGKPIKGGGGGTGGGGGGDTTTNNSTNVIFLNFWGKTISGTMWNVNGDFTVGAAGLGQTEIDAALAGVREHYKDYNVNVTTIKAEFDAAAYGHKIEVLITEDWSWFGQAGGVAYINSWSWGDGSPAFVFSSLLNYNPHYIEEAAAHEAGHTLGLRHQSDCVNGSVTNQYSYGKTMGYSYDSYPVGPWVTGTNSLCVQQIDQAIIQSVLGLRLIASYYLRPKNKSIL